MWIAAGTGNPCIHDGNQTRQKNRRGLCFFASCVVPFVGCGSVVKNVDLESFDPHDLNGHAQS